MAERLWWLEPGAIVIGLGIVANFLRSLIKGKIDNDKEQRKREDQAWEHMKGLLEPMTARVNCLEMKVTFLSEENLRLRQRLDEVEELNERLKTGIEKLIARLVALGQDPDQFDKEIFLT